MDSEPEWTVKGALAQYEIDPPELDSLSDFYAMAARLKKVNRTGWLRHGIDAESVADHSCLMALLTFALPGQVDTIKCMRMCLVHDLAEALVGDITPMSGVSKDEKHRREEATFSYLAEQWPRLGATVRDLWLEFEKKETLESQHANDLDKMEMMLQACEYEKQYGVDLKEFFGVSVKVITPWGQSETERILKKRDAYWTSHPERRRRDDNAIGHISESEMRALHDRYYD